MTSAFQYHSASMDTLDPAGEYLRLAERYRQMGDEELLLLIPQTDELTPSAQQALAGEVRHRGLKLDAKADEKASVKPSFAAPKSRPEPPSLQAPTDDDSLDADATYEEERKLVELCTVWSLRDALKVQSILDGAGIPFFIGPEKATGVDHVTSNFANGVSVQIMQVGVPWAAPLMQNYDPQDEPTPKYNDVLDGLPVRCPRCNSEEVIFTGLTSAPGAPTDKSTQKFQWTCESCGETWEDDGVVKEG
jgi:hypothetical protein